MLDIHPLDLPIKIKPKSTKRIEGGNLVYDIISGRNTKSRLCEVEDPIEIDNALKSQNSIGKNINTVECYDNAMNYKITLVGDTKEYKRISTHKRKQYFHCVVTEGLNKTKLLSKCKDIISSNRLGNDLSCYVQKHNVGERHLYQVSVAKFLKFEQAKNLCQKLIRNNQRCMVEKFLVK